MRNQNEAAEQKTPMVLEDNPDVKFEGYVTDEFGEVLAEFSGVFVF